MMRYDQKLDILDDSDEDIAEPPAKRARLENGVADGMTVELHQHDSDGTSQEEDGTDGMGISFVNEEDCGFFGKRSCLRSYLNCLLKECLRPILEHCFNETCCRRDAPDEGQC